MVLVRQPSQPGGAPLPIPAHRRGSRARTRRATVAGRHARCLRSARSAGGLIVLLGVGVSGLKGEVMAVWGAGGRRSGPALAAALRGHQLMCGPPRLQS